VVNRKLLVTTGLVAVVTVAALFFFQCSFGSFSATHGPVTAMRAARESLRIKTSFIVMLFTAVLIVSAMRCWLFSRMPREEVPALLLPLGPAVRI
jgi:hypothetical protein